MHLNRSGKDIIIGLDTKEEAIGLHAFLSGTAHTVPPELAERGKYIYEWFFAAITKLATSYQTESEAATQSAETGTIPQFKNPSKKRNR